METTQSEFLNTGSKTNLQKRKGGCGKYIFIILLFFIIIGAGIFYWKYYYTYSDGYRSGMLQKLSHKGNLMKTYEGELVLSSIASTNNVALASEKFLFSVASDSVAKKMMDYEGKKVKLHYEQKKGTLPWRGESEYIVDEVLVEQ